MSSIDDVFTIVDFHDAWQATTYDGNPLTNHDTYELKADTTPTVFTANVSYNNIYPPCDLLLYKTEEGHGSEKCEGRSKDKVTVVNGKYSLQLDINQ